MRITSRPTRTKTADNTHLAAGRRELIRRIRIPNDTPAANARAPLLMNLFDETRWPPGPSRID